MDAVFETHLPLPGRRQGKVRDLYDLGATPGAPGGALLMVATDRISAFDVVMPTPIPGKGRLLTDLSTRWFDLIRRLDIAPIHLIGTDVSGLSMLSAAEKELLRGRSMVCRKCRVVPIECVVRGYLDGSGWADYRKTGMVCGVRLPTGLRRGDRLPEPIFTPATKELVGVHDENISFERASERVGAGVMHRLRELSLAIYGAAHEHARARGLILADTKFEFGFDGAAPDQPVLVDEALTPDSSRYWDLGEWSPGREQASFDKQFLREYLNRLVGEGRWDKKPPGPELPPEVVAGTLARYETARRRLFD